MAQIIVRFATGNDAFRDGVGAPIMEAISAQIREAADRVDRLVPDQGTSREIFLRDPNGNRIGEILVEEDPPEAGDLSWSCECGGCSWTNTDCCGGAPFCQTGSDGDIVVCQAGKGCSQDPDDLLDDDLARMLLLP